MKKTLLMLLVLIASAVAKAQVQTVYDITVTAQDDKSGIWMVIGEDNLANVEELTLTGTINGYDFMVMRDKMPNLRVLDMENVNIVANDYVYYNTGLGGIHSLDNKITAYAFNDKGLTSVKLPKSIVSIETHAFTNCNLTAVEIPSDVESIGSYAFKGSHLSSVDFSKCKKLKSIGELAFTSCNLTSIRIPETILTISNSAFSFNSNLQNVYVQPIIPRQLVSTAFSGINISNVTLHVPPMTKENYYWATGWSTFGTIVEDVNPDYFYVDADLTIAENKADNKTVDADVEANGGIINEDSHT